MASKVAIKFDVHFDTSATKKVIGFKDSTGTKTEG